MTLVPGRRLGPYEVVAPLGAGGMGEVFRARDPRLGRDVAIKALPPAFAQDPERLARFEREAKLLASLSHPNVAGIHGLEDVEGARYLVLEFVDGETLESRLHRGALPLEDVLDVARQVAAGVEAAHEAGVVHRDLKPGNVMIHTGGAVKVLDFGLAKAGTAGGSGSDPNLTASPTITHAATQAGVILGTAAYMSPEQARGKMVDRRTDIWSFGALLFECLTARRAFDGETVSDMVARILEREPDWSALPPATPPRLVTLLKRCMVKDPRQRLRDMGDARLELDAIAAGDRGEAPAAAAASARRGAPAWTLALGAVSVIAAVAWIGAAMLGRDSGPALSVSLSASSGLRMGPNPSDLAISPDGRRVVFVASDTSSGERLWIRDLDRDNARPLVQTERPRYPFWAPDSRRVGFFADGKLKTVDLGSGAVRTLADAVLPRGGGWGKGEILFQPLSIGPLYRVSEDGGEAKIVLAVDTSNTVGYRFPQFLPDGRHFIAVGLPNRGLENLVFLGELGRPGVRLVGKAGYSAGPTLVGGDWLLVPRDGAVRAQRLDPRTHEPRGPALEIPGLRVASPSTNGSPLVSASWNGIITQRAATDLPQRLAVVDRSGRTVSEISGPEGTFLRGQVAPDGRHAVFEYASPANLENTNLWVADLVRGGMQPFTFESGNTSPMYSPDGSEIVYNCDKSLSSQDLWVMRADVPGSGRLVRLMERPFNTVVSVAPDGRGALMRSQGRETQQDLVYVSWRDSVRFQPILATRFNETVGGISPDGHWIAYVSDESGRNECSVRSFPDASGRVITVSHGAYSEPNSQTRIGSPVWRRDGRELLYAAADGRTLMVADVTPGNPPSFGEPRPLFRLPPATADIAVCDDLHTFVLSITREDEGRATATLLVNWPKLLAKAK